jgi:hypothetical protein
VIGHKALSTFCTDLHNPAQNPHTALHPVGYNPLSSRGRSWKRGELMSDGNRAGELQRRRVALGTLLARRRRDRRKSQVVLAAALLCDRSTLSRVENGAIPEDRRFWEQCDTELAAGGELLGAFDALIRFRDGIDDVTPVSTSAEPSVDLPVMVNGHPMPLSFDAVAVAADKPSSYPSEHRAAGYPSGNHATGTEGQGMSPLGRRSLLTRGIAAAALTALGLDEVQRVAAAMEDARRYLDGPVIDYFRRQLTMCKTEDGSLGPAAALPVVIGILGAIEEHARSVTPDIRR